MTQTALVLIILVLIGLWYMRGRATSVKKASTPILDKGAYVALLGMALLLAWLWH